MKETNREYAEALFTIAAENNLKEEYSKSLGLIRAAIKENPQYLLLLDSPAVPLSQRLAAIDEAFEKTVPEYIVSFLKLLCENGRIKELDLCIDEFEKLKRFASNITTATIYSVVELSDVQKKKLCEKLAVLLCKTVEAEFIVDPKLIGGIKIEADGKTLDGSIENHLKKIKGVMN